MAATTAPAPRHLALGLAVGLLAASIGALYTVFARWGIAQGMSSPDLTVLRLGTAGLVTLPVLVWALWRDVDAMLARWRVWLLIAMLAGTPFGLLMFGALQWAPSSHAAIFPFAAMSVMGMLLSAWVLGDPLTRRRLTGITIVLVGLVVLSGVTATAFTGLTLLGDLMFIAAGGPLGRFWHRPAPAPAEPPAGHRRHFVFSAGHLRAGLPADGRHGATDGDRAPRAGG